jgi:hypothetical protein
VEQVPNVVVRIADDRVDRVHGVGDPGQRVLDGAAEITGVLAGRGDRQPVRAQLSSGRCRAERDDRAQVELPLSDRCEGADQALEHLVELAVDALHDVMRRLA